MHVRNVRDFKTKRDSEVNSSFLLNEHGDPQFSFQVFAKNSLIKDIFEEEEKVSQLCFQDKTLRFPSN